MQDATNQVDARHYYTDEENSSENNTSLTSQTFLCTLEAVVFITTMKMDFLQIILKSNTVQEKYRSEQYI